MKKFTLLFALLLAATCHFAQAPQAFNYQAIARDLSGNPLINQAISVKISILNGSTTGTEIYSGNYQLLTNNSGLFDLKIGNPDEVLTGNFNDILWGIGSWFLQVEIDPAGGSDFQMMGTSQLLSVPYSLSSASLTLHSPNGTSYEIAVDDQGNLITNCVPDPSQANAGPDQLDVEGTSATLGGNTPEFGQGLWSILSGENGNFVDATNPTTIFTGEVNEMYALQWQIHTACDTTYDTVNINFVAPPQLAIGDEYGGGIVAYILQVGDPGYVTGEVNGFIAAGTDQGFLPWGCQGTSLPGADGLDLGTGYQNTLDIVTGCGNASIAAKICNDLELNGYNDWYLPSKEELNKLYLNKELIGDFFPSYYWCSSETTSLKAWMQEFIAGTQAQYNKNSGKYIRAIRTFSYTPFTCGDAFTDTRDGNTYATVQIGDQCWMAENLNIGTRINGSSDQTDNSIIEKYCYDDSEANCDVYGGLYQWDEMMEYETTEGAKGICMEGWHVPTDAEWCILEQEVDPTINCSSTGFRGVDGGTKLKQGGSSGFEALLAGTRDIGWDFLGIGSFTSFWSASESGTSAWRRHLDLSKATVYRGYSSKAYGISVRCLKDN